MSIGYPNGTPSFSHFPKDLPKMQGKKSTTSFANRGMNLEEAINESNRYYLSQEKAVIYKKPTPIQIVKVDYPKRSAAVIKEAYFAKASTTDYNGVYQGYYLDFEAKETKNKTSFPLSNFHLHQIQHFESCLKQGGICFALLYFSTLKKIYLIEAKDLIDFWYQQEKNRKSIPLKYIEEHSILLPMKIAPRIPYLEGVDELLQRRNS